MSACLSDENFRVNVSSKIFYIHPIENFLTFNISRRSLLLTGGSPDFTNGNRCPSPEWPTIEYCKNGENLLICRQSSYSGKYNRCKEIEITAE